MRMCVHKSEVANINTRLNTGLLALLILSESARKPMHPKLSLNSTSNMLKNISRIKTYCAFSYFTTMLMSKILKKISRLSPLCLSKKLSNVQSELKNNNPRKKSPAEDGDTGHCRKNQITPKLTSVKTHTLDSFTSLLHGARPSLTNLFLGGLENDYAGGRGAERSCRASQHCRLLDGCSPCSNSGCSAAVSAPISPLHQTHQRSVS